MANVRVSYGPPGQKGVTTIIGLGAADVEGHPSDRFLGAAGWFGIAVWALGVVINRPQIRGVGLGAAAVGFGVKYVVNRELSKTPATPIPVPPPTSGW